MAIDLKSHLSPPSTAVLCMEMQRGVVGDLSPIEPLVHAVANRGVVPQLARLIAAARNAGVQIAYCNALHRADRKGSATNCPMLARSAKADGMIEGTPDVEIVPELAARREDIVSGRYHGMSPFTGTSLDITLRNLGIRTVVATGVSLNVGLIAMCAEAVALGYRVVIPRDCVAGVPDEYAEAVLRNTMPVLASVVHSDELLAVWES
ncbi:cysteine hydrolase [Paraburkholderia phymatum]|uniref:cysteine hydrolase n=1 Tax=Paraburkholderia phymatum TaxID=148447 RepID=UPI0031813706